MNSLWLVKACQKNLEKPVPSHLPPVLQIDVPPVSNPESVEESLRHLFLVSLSQCQFDGFLPLPLSYWRFYPTREFHLPGWWALRPFFYARVLRCSGYECWHHPWFGRYPVRHAPTLWWIEHGITFWLYLTRIEQGVLFQMLRRWWLCFYLESSVETIQLIVSFCFIALISFICKLSKKLVNVRCFFSRTIWFWWFDEGFGNFLNKMVWFFPKKTRLEDFIFKFLSLFLCHALLSVRICNLFKISRSFSVSHQSCTDEHKRLHVQEWGRLGDWFLNIWSRRVFSGFLVYLYSQTDSHFTRCREHFLNLADPVCVL